jgi:ribonuclease P protein component
LVCANASEEVQVKRRFRLTRSNDIKRVRRSGKSYAHPLVVLYALRSEGADVRVGLSASVTIGNAVRRNRAKRLMREAMARLIPGILPGVELLLIARATLPDADLFQTQDAVQTLLGRAGLLIPVHDS